MSLLSFFSSSSSFACLFAACREMEDVTKKTKDIQLLRVTKSSMAEAGVSEDEKHRRENEALDRNIKAAQVAHERSVQERRKQVGSIKKQVCQSVHTPSNMPLFDCCKFVADLFSFFFGLVLFPSPIFFFLSFWVAIIKIQAKSKGQGQLDGRIEEMAGEVVARESVHQLQQATINSTTNTVFSPKLSCLHTHTHTQRKMKKSGQVSKGLPIIFSHLFHRLLCLSSCSGRGPRSGAYWKSRGRSPRKSPRSPRSWPACARDRSRPFPPTTRQASKQASKK
jgi:hypothetical protein